MRKLVLSLLLLAVPLAGRCDPLETAVKADLPELLALYKHLHQNPELSYQEEKSAARMAEELRKAGYTVTENVGGHGVVAVLKNGAGPTLLMRSDMDALPVKEQTGVAYASSVMAKDAAGNDVPVMHACGHDIHMTSMIGAARRLSAMKSQWKGTLVIVMQPAEEIAGAIFMLKDGLYERFPKPDHAIALHDSAALPAGKIDITPGFIAAWVDSVDIDVRGVGGHGAYPESTKDPVVIASQIVLALQTLISRETAPQDAAVITVGSIHGGFKHNIISDSVKLQITVRSYEEATRQHILEGIKRVAAAQAQSAGVPADKMPVVKISDYAYPATWNTEKQTLQLTTLFKKHFGEGNVVKSKPSMGGEDFSEFYRANPKMESTMFNIGGVKQSTYDEAMKTGKQLPSLHSPFWAPDPEPTINTGVKALTLAALDILKK